MTGAFPQYTPSATQNIAWQYSVTYVTYCRFTLIKRDKVNLWFFKYWYVTEIFCF